jgi:perosamine synthetase
MCKACRKYEAAFAEMFGAKRAFSFWKGRVGLYGVLKTMGIGPGDEVILPGYTCVMDVNPIIYLGAKAIYVDIEPFTYNMDAALLESKITSRTKLIIVQHTYGYVADLDTILGIAGRHKIPVIEDCCLSIGSRYKGVLTGNFTPVAYFSSQWNKTYTTGLGGMVICYDSEFIKKLEKLCDERLIKVTPTQTLLMALQIMLYRAIIYPKTTEIIRKI